MKAKGCEVPLWRRRSSRIVRIALVAVVLALATSAAGIAQRDVPVFPELIPLPATLAPKGSPWAGGTRSMLVRSWRQRSARSSSATCGAGLSPSSCRRPEYKRSA